MAQYAIYSDGDYVECTDGVNSWRDGNRAGCFVHDFALTPQAFSGVENTDWVNVDLLGDGTQCDFRDGVRDLEYVVDRTLTSTGFDGTEDVDWENLEPGKTD